MWNSAYANICKWLLKNPALVGLDSAAVAGRGLAAGGGGRGWTATVCCLEVTKEPLKVHNLHR